VSDDEATQRVLFDLVAAYRTAIFLGGDSEILRDAVRVAREELIRREWWPEEERADLFGIWLGAGA
jgi:hypothetical protein